MRLPVTIALIAGMTGPARAHILGEQESLVGSLVHQLFGLHHLPFTIVLLIGAAIGLRQIVRMRRRRY